MDNIQKLLLEVKPLVQREQLHQVEKIQRGECFNIFQTMSMESNEVKTHSALIAELLNPKGSHGCGDVFLKAFLTQCGIDLDFEIDSTNVYTEYYIGAITKDYQKGGRIDILAKDAKNHMLIIENKIYAGDQYQQLERYKQYVTDSHSTYKIVYLTLWGTKPSPQSSKEGEAEIPNDILCISYFHTISEWLKVCIQMVATKPIIRETLIQYQILINNLCNKTMTNNNLQEQISLMRDDIESTCSIYNAYGALVDSLFKDTLFPQLDELSSQLGMKFHSWMSDKSNFLNTSWVNFKFQHPAWNHVVICFEFEKQGLEHCICGFYYLDSTKKGEMGKSYLINLPNLSKHTDLWPAYKSFEPKDWNNSTTFQQIMSGELAQKIINAVKQLMEIAKDQNL